MSVRIVHADCLDAMRDLPADSIDAIVTDPPYGLGFMGREWDALPPGLPWALECLRVLKPGGHLAAFGGTRTAHRMTCAIEDAGFEIRDTLAWLYGSGFPKSLDVSKAIDKAAGAAREVVGQRDRYRDGIERENRGDRNDVYGDGLTANGVADITAPATPDAETWQGWGTALKPAHEPITLARKPLAGTVAVNVLKHGTGALNIDASRIGDPGKLGRWPANVILDAAAAAMLDEQTGTLASNSGKAFTRNADKDRHAFGAFDGNEAQGFYGDKGGASRFFYTAKSSGRERNRGLGANANLLAPDAPDANTHPTVKPLDLMRWLVRLVGPPGGTILDPFAGSGSTGLACVVEAFDAILIERDAEYVEIIRARISGA